MFFFLILLPSCIEASDIVVQKIDVEGLYSIEKEELLDILDIKPGSVLTPLNVRNGIKMAFLKGIFEDISVEVDDADRGYVRIKVREKDMIKSIYVRGNNSLSKSVIKNHFPLKEGHVMRYDLIEDSVKGLKAALSERGFPRADINLSVEKTGRPYRVNLHLKVSEGAPERIKSIKVIGPAETAKFITMSDRDIYDQYRLKRDMDKIKAYYKKNNYLSPKTEYLFMDGVLEINIDHGKRLDVTFKGNAAIGAKSLYKELPFFDAGDFREDLVEEAVLRITALYHSYGYPFAQVASVITFNEDVIGMHFFIFEGEKITVNSVSFTGVSVPVESLRGIMSLKQGEAYNPALIDTDRKVLIEFYNALGYLNMRVDDVRVSIKDSKADIAISITEGVQIRIEDIEIMGNEYISKEMIKKVIKVKTGDPYNEVDISDARYRIVELYGTHGFTDSRVGVRQEFSEKGVRVIFEVEEGTLTFWGKTVVSGNTDTKHEVIKRELLYREGEPFDYTLTTKTRQRLYKLGLFTDVDVETLENAANKKNVHIRVKEGNAGTVEFGFGYGDYERLRGSFDISYRNLLGMNRQISLRTEFSSLEKRYIINYLEPWFLDKPIPLRVILLKEDRKEKDIETHEIKYRLKRYTASAGIEKKLSEKFKGEIFYEFSQVKTYDVKEGVILTREDTGTLAISAIRPGIVYDTRDNPFDPRRGVLAGISIKAASRLFLSETDFLKVVVNGSAYKELSKYFVVAAALKGGVGRDFDRTQELPLVERFFLGGRTTVRGYEQDMLGPKGSDGSPTGGNAFALVNLELRTSLGKGIGIVTFLDGGNVWVKAGDVNLSDLKYTVGLGIRYNTPVGPLRVDYGYKLDRDLICVERKPPKDPRCTMESPSAVHFSIGHAF